MKLKDELTDKQNNKWINRHINKMIKNVDDIMGKRKKLIKDNQRIGLLE